MGNFELFLHEKIDFLNGRVLTAEMMMLLQSQTERFWEQYRSYPDGVLWGLDIREDGGELIVLPGAIKLGGQ